MKSLIEKFDGNARTAYVAISNEDLTEGRGRKVPAAVSLSATTAMRVGKGAGVQGTSCPVQKITIYRVDGWWYGPVRLIEPTAEDDRRDDAMREYEKALQAARDAGLTDAQVAALQKGGWPHA